MSEVLCDPAHKVNVAAGLLISSRGQRSEAFLYRRQLAGGALRHRGQHDSTGVMERP